MHVPWGWIKQRPHFIAEGLAKEFHVDVNFELPYYKRHLISNSINDVNLKHLFRFPFSRFRLIELINLYCIKYQLKKNILNYKYIWLTHPYLYMFIKDIISDKQILIYDCMDDSLEFEHVKSKKRVLKRLITSEEYLCKRADLIICSASSLKNKLIERYSPDVSIHVINNAINIISDSLQTDVPPDISFYLSTCKRKKIIYVGTISSWMDWELIIASLIRFKEIEYIFIGPCDTIIPNHERIKHFGPVQHSCIFKLMNYADILVMPFILSDLIKGVNPVKVYEYIYSGKPVIVKKYEETLQFKDFVNLYEDNIQYIKLIDSYLEGNPLVQKPMLENKKFALANTWVDRIEEINNLIGEFKK